MSPPSRAWYVVSAAIFLVGLIAFASFLFLKLSRLNEGYVRVLVPGEAEVSLEKPGRYIIHHEFKSVFEGRVYSTPEGEGLQGMKIEVYSLPGDRPVAVQDTTLSASYSFGSYSGVSLMEFQAEQPGRFRLRGTRDDGSTRPQAVLSIAQSSVGDIVATVFGGIAIFFGSIILSVGVFVWTLIQRGKALKAAKGSAA